MDWTTGLTQTAIKIAFFSVAQKLIRPVTFLKVAPLACRGIVSVEALSSESVEVKGHMIL